MKTKKEMLLVDPDNGETTGLEIGSEIKSPAQQQSSKEYFDKQNQKMQQKLDEAKAKKQKKYYRNLQLGELGKYIIVRVKLIPGVDDVTAANLGRLIYLSTYCDYHNRLMLTENTTMKRGDLPAVLNLGERKTRDFLNDMARYIRFGDNGIYISDSFVYRGEKKERNNWI